MAVVHSQLNVKTATGYDQLYLQNAATDVLYTNTSGLIAATTIQGAFDDLEALVNDKSAKAVVVSATLSTSSWTGSSAPYTQTVSVTGVSADGGVVIVALSKSATAQQRAWALGCGLVCTTKGNGTITISANAFKPASNIPIVVALLDGASEIINAIPVQVPTKRVELCRFTTSGTFNPADYPTLDGLYDAYIVGGGGGEYRYDYSSNLNLVTGGGGGYCKLLHSLAVLVPTNVIIGAAGVAGRNNTLTSGDNSITATNGGETRFGSNESAAGGRPSTVYDGGDGGSGGAGIGGSFGGVDGNNGTAGMLLLNGAMDTSGTTTGTAGTGGGTENYTPTNPYDDKSYGVGGSSAYVLPVSGSSYAHSELNFPPLNNNAGRGGGNGGSALPGVCIIYGYKLGVTA